jgi:hypothetical protein
MATRIETSREAKRVQATMLWDVSDAAFTVTGKAPRLDMRGFPSKNGANITAVTYTSQA